MYSSPIFTVAGKLRWFKDYSKCITNLTITTVKQKLNSQPSFTQREMNAIAAMLLSSDGINVDPIIEDIYPQVSDEDKSMFRCKIALLLKGNMPEFKPFTVFRRISNSIAYMYKVESESSLLGICNLREIQKYTKQDDGSWEEEEVTTASCQSVSAQELKDWYCPTLDEAIQRW